MEEKWNKVILPALTAQEKTKSENKIKTDVPAIGYREIQVETNFTNRNFKLIYLPAFLGNYLYDNRTFSFIVNGRDGVYDGQRPEYGKKILRKLREISENLKRFGKIGRC